MRKAAKQIMVCAALLAVLCAACRFAFLNRFSIYVPVRDARAGDTGPEEIQFRTEDPGVLRTGTAERRNGYICIPVIPEAPGEADITADLGDGSGLLFPLQVDVFGTVYDKSSGNFTGDAAVLAAVTLFWLLVSAIMLWHFTRARGSAFYDYGTVYYAGFSMFAFVSGATMLYVTVCRAVRPESCNMLEAYSVIRSASLWYMLLTTPVMILFAAALAVSNIALLRHERPSPQNALGLLVSLLLVAGEAAGWYLFGRDYMGSEWQGRIDSALQNTYATAFIYCQCMLTGSVICGIRAARHVPDTDKDFIIILGCWFRKDGTLPPLLRDRAEKALDFWRMQRQKTGKEAFFIPSGGQGADEPMPEAEAIRRFLLSRGVEDRLILPEARSVNTLQSMEFSGKIIREAGPEGKAAFATSSYHVFRSGLLARQAGLSAEGVGSRTKWWFWPNAFIRETAGLLAKRWKQETAFLILLIAFFAVLSMALW